MTVTKTDMQVSTLKELVLAKHAMDRAQAEFTAALGIRINDDRVALLAQQLGDIDPREVSEDTLSRILFLTGIAQ